MDEYEFSLKGHRFKRYNESNFVLIFYQNYPFSGLFHSDQECNKSLLKNKYSIIGLIDDKYRINEYFHFLLEYPELSAKLEFKQKLPITSTSSNVQAISYNKTYNNFHGLAVSGDKNSTCFDGTPGAMTSLWFYAIGMKTKYEGYQIPGPQFVNNNTFINVKKVLLWMKYDDINLLRNLPSISLFCTQKQARTRTPAFLVYYILLIYSK